MVLSERNIQHNPYIGKKKKDGLYNVQDRYGLWLCKDFVPIMRKNEWIVTKGSEFTRYHAFFNCQAFRLTANRGSVDSTDSKVMQNIERVIRMLKTEVESGEEWGQWDDLEGQASGEKTRDREASDWKRRFDRVKRKKYAEYKGIKLLQPTQEGGVFALLTQTSMLVPDLYPFEIIDYDTHTGIDLIVRTLDKTKLGSNFDYRYLELKYSLKETFNHCFQHLYGIMCWQISDGVLDGQPVKDALEDERHLYHSSQGTGDTQYFLKKDDTTPLIPVFVLERYLKDKLGISFNKPRSL